MDLARGGASETEIYFTRKLNTEHRRLQRSAWEQPGEVRRKCILLPPRLIKPSTLAV